MAHPSKELTLVVFKPDAVQRGIIGEITARFERAGLKIVGAKMLQPSADHYYHHYETIGKLISRRGQKAFDSIANFMQSGPVIALVLEGVEAVGLVRKLTGATEPKAALPGTIRGDYAHTSFAHADKFDVGVPNLIHASSDPEEAKAEIAHWFSESEIFDYETAHDKFTQPLK
ncbi:MAG: nucleoside-diphosphate kinase [Candidatus Pacebacteria bacterium]|nr:nucleoside-diphosphate kinase [Candidatus Paceibacterota bacterium]